MLSAASDGDDAVFATAATQIEAATEAGHPGAQSALAFLTGTGMTRMASRSLAFLLHKFAADAGDLQSKMALAYSYFRLEVRWPRPFASQHRQRLHRDAQRQHPQPDAGGRWEKSASHLARDRQIHTLCIGAAAGHACLMLAAGKKGKRYMFPHAKAMIQQPRIPSYGMMQASDFVIRAKELVYRSSYDRSSWCHFQQALG